jgi:hypothetical protein
VPPPTIGRIVNVRHPRWVGPRAAIITHVFPDGTIEAHVFTTLADATTNPAEFSGMPLIEPADPRPPEGPWAEWPIITRYPSTVGQTSQQHPLGASESAPLGRETVNPAGGVSGAAAGHVQPSPVGRPDPSLN